MHKPEVMPACHHMETSTTQSKHCLKSCESQKINAEDAQTWMMPEVVQFHPQLNFFPFLHNLQPKQELLNPAETDHPPKLS